MPAHSTSGAAHQVGEIAALPKQSSIDHAISDLKVLHSEPYNTEIVSFMLVLIHHGDALGPDLDPMRPLSGPGRAASARLAAAARGVKPDLFWHSGKLRSRQTAELFWCACNPLAALSAARGLQPTDPPQLMVDQLAGDTRSLALVGHMPHLARLLRVLCAHPADATATEFPLHGCVALERDEGLWKELWRLDA